MKQSLLNVGWFIVFVVGGGIAAGTVKLLSVFVLGGVVLPLVPLMSYGRIVKLLACLVAFVAQVYFWATWAAFCAESIRWFISRGGDASLYWCSGFFIAPVPLVEMTRQESQMADDPRASANAESAGTLWIIGLIGVFVMFGFSPEMQHKLLPWLQFHPGTATR